MKSTFPLTVMTLLLAASSLFAATHYVSLESTSPTPPYTNWATAATNIQDAVDVATTNDVVVVTNGVYTGGEWCVVDVETPLTLLSVNGPQVTVIDGGAQVRCAYLSDGASLTGFTLTNGWSDNGAGVWCASRNAFLTNCVIVGNLAVGSPVSNVSEGGGAWGGTLYNCTLSRNWAHGQPPFPPPSGWPGQGGGAYGSELYNCILNGNSATGTYPQGGGADHCTLYNCTLTGNSAPGGWGGGANFSRLYNCTLTGNSAKALGGGASVSALYNCIAYYNTAPEGSNYDSSSTLNNCCTTPIPTNGLGNIDADPLLMDTNGWSNLRLQSNSPCINAGNNDLVTSPTDLDGNPRMVSGTVDIGAYEYQGTGSRISYAWLQQYGLPTDGSADFIDSDGDGLNNWQEWVCGTCPTNAQSALRLVSAVPNGTNVVVTWQSVAGVNYFLECSTNLASSFMHLASFITGQPGTTSYADTNVAGAGRLFYRVGVLPSGSN